MSQNGNFFFSSFVQHFLNLRKKPWMQSTIRLKEVEKNYVIIIMLMSIVIGGSWTLCFLFMLLLDDNFWCSYICDNNRNEINDITYKNGIQYLRKGVEWNSDWIIVIRAHFLELQIVLLFWMNFYLVDIFSKINLLSFRAVNNLSLSWKWFEIEIVILHAIIMYQEVVRKVGWLYTLCYELFVKIEDLLAWLEVRRVRHNQRKIPWMVKRSIGI